MALRRRWHWRGLALCAVLELGLLAGVPMRPDEIARLMRWLGQPRAERTDPDEAGKGEGPVSGR
jgi:hypothetical protein